MWGRWIWAALIAVGLSGCAEFNNRGGALDWMADRVIKADTKQMRVIRSYIMLAALTRLASKSPTSAEERDVIAYKVGKTFLGIQTAYECSLTGTIAKSPLPPRGCAFFDDKMATVDYGLIRLARSVFMPEENKDLLVLIRKGLGDELGITSGIFDFMDTTGKVVDSGGGVLKLGGQTLDAAGAIMRLISTSFRTGGRLSPIYRDAIELEMQILIDFLEEKCPSTGSVQGEYCHSKAGAVAIYKNGTGNLKEWRHEVHAIFDLYAGEIVPKDTHFQQVTDLLDNACEELTATEEARKNCLSKENKGYWNRKPSPQ